MVLNHAFCVIISLQKTCGKVINFLSVCFQLDPIKTAQSGI